MNVTKYLVKSGISLDVYRNHQVIKRVFPSSKFVYSEANNGFEVTTQGIPEGGVVCKKKESLIGSSMVFSLRVNLVKRNNSTKKREAITDPAEALSWIKNKASLSGFSVDSIEVAFEGIRTGKKRGQFLTFNSVLFSGVLTVNDESKFSSSVYEGFGPAKAFGFGAMVWKTESI